MKYSVILPAYNEAESIEQTLSALLALEIGEFEILVVDDNSPDGTFGIVSKIAEKHPSVRALLHRGERGLGPSVVYGFEQAAGSILACMDADGQHRAPDLVSLLADFRDPELDMAVGSRHVPGGGFTEKWNPVRSFISRAAAVAARLLLGVEIRDPMSGFFAVRRGSFDAVKKYLDPHGFKIMLEIYFLLSLRKRHGLRESPIVFAMRRAGKSKLSFKVVFQYLAMLGKCLFRRARLKKQLNGE